MSGYRRKRTHTSVCAHYQVSRELNKIPRARPLLICSLRLCAQKPVPVFYIFLLARASINCGKAAFLKRRQSRKEPSCAWTITLFCSPRNIPVLAALNISLKIFRCRDKMFSVSSDFWSTFIAGIKTLLWPFI